MTEHRNIAPQRLVFALAIACCGCHDAGPGETLPPLALPLTNRIVFDSKRADTLGDVFVMKLDGSEVRRLTDGSTKDACPSISPDGNWIALYRKAVSDTALRYDLRPDSLALMRASGEDVKMLAPVWYSPTQCPVWSSDSRAFAVEETVYSPSKQTPLYQIRTFALDGRLLAQFSPYGLAGVTLSPDGSRLAGESYQIGCCGPYGGTILTLNIDGTVARSLGQGGGPTWSPVRNEVAYLCAGLCVAADDGSSPRQVVPDQSFGPFGSPPAYASDGSTVGLSCGGNLCIVDLQTGATTSSSLGVTAGRFAWTPDNQSLVFTCSVPPYYVGDICSIRRDGSGFSNLTNNPSADDSPSLSPGGP
jgi:Tol biopolymer transport system component